MSRCHSPTRIVCNAKASTPVIRTQAQTQERPGLISPGVQVTNCSQDVRLEEETASIIPRARIRDLPAGANHAQIVARFDSPGLKHAPVDPRSVSGFDQVTEALTGGNQFRFRGTGGMHKLARLFQRGFFQAGNDPA